MHERYLKQMDLKEAYRQHFYRVVIELKVVKKRSKYVETDVAIKSTFFLVWVVIYKRSET